MAHTWRSKTLNFAWLLTVAGVLPLTAWSETFNPTRFDDPVPNGCQPGDCSLREAVLAANDTPEADTIVLSNGTYQVLLNGSESSLTGDLDVRSGMRIRGPATIDGQNQGRIFDIDDESHVLFEDLTLQNANSSLATNGTLNGGAVQVSSGSLTLRSVVLRDNATQAQGAGVYTIDGAILRVEDSVFYNNVADNGAGIFVTDDLTVRNTVFLDNRADLRGAAVYVQGTQSDATFREVSLIGNESLGSGGGAVLFLGRDLRIDNLLATGNQCLDGFGGVLTTTGTAHGKSVLITNALFLDNEAEDGGALSLADDEDPVEIIHSAFVDNSALDNAGAIYTTGGLIDIANVTFSGNSAVGDGGTLWLFGKTIAFRQVTITGGSADRGSALFVGGSTAISEATLVNTIVEGDCTFVNADTVSSGGGNVESPGNSCGFNDASDQRGVSAQDLGIGPLQQADGVTPFHPLGPSSVARGAGVPLVCAALTLDQVFGPRASNCSAGSIDGAVLFADGFQDLPSVGSNLDFNP